jgi:hypothetical protein
MTSSALLPPTPDDLSWRVTVLDEHGETQWVLSDLEDYVARRHIALGMDIVAHHPGWLVVVEADDGATASPSPDMDRAARAPGGPLPPTPRRSAA